MSEQPYRFVLRPSSAAKADLLPRAMAPSASKNCFSTRNVRMHILALVAHKNSPDTLHNLDFSVMKDADGVFFIDDRDSYTEVLAKMATHCRKPVSRIFYIDSDDDELPIDSEVEYKEALKLIGQRTNKGQVTSMRIETGGLPKNEKKRVKKHSKVARVKVAAKPSDSSPPKKITSTNKAESEPTLQKVSTSDESSTKIKHGVSQTWLKNYLQEFKKELMADFESLLEPYVAEQKKMADMITSLNAALMSNKNCSETVAIINTKEQTEFDHNYSASASCMNAQLAKDLTKPKLDEIIHLSDDEELVLPCSSFDEDDNLSIYSGEISVTESESDGSADDFVEVPLPSCFDVVAIQEGSTHKKGPKELKHMKTSLKVKVGKMGREVIAKCEEKPHSKTNAKPEVNCNFVMRNPFTSNQDNQPVIKALIAPMESNNSIDTIDGHFVDDEDYDEVELEIEEDYVDVGEEEGHNFDCNYGEAFTEEFDAEKVDNQPDNGKQESISSGTFTEAFLDQSGNDVQVSDEVTELEQEFTPTMESIEQNGNLALQEEQDKYLQADLPASPQNGNQYNVVNVAHAHQQTAPKLPLYSAQSHQGVLNPQPPMFVLTGCGSTVPGSVPYMQLPEAPSMATPLQAVQHPLVLQSQPLMKMPQPMWKAVKTLSTQRFIETAQAAVQAQHQQIIRAAQRAAVQAQQTQALGLPQTLLQQARPPTTLQEKLPTSSGLRPNSQTPALLGENLKVRKTGNNQVGSVPRQIQEAAQELRLWNEVDHVDLELRKWVQMCQQLMESIPKQVDDSSPMMPECLKKLASTAGKTHQDLEKVYQNFRKEVQMVSTQMDARKLQKQEQGCAQLIADDPIVILPEKLMNIISGTLNTTFNILGNIAKLGVAPSSVLPEQSTAPSSVEKPQPHTSANVSPMAPALGNTNNVRLGMGYTAQPMHPYFQSYISPLSMLGSETVCSMLADPLANQDANMAYRMRPVGAVGASTFGPSYPLIWGQNVSTYTTAQTLGQTQTQPTMLGQPQAPQPQAPATVPRQLPQQMLPMQLALHHPHQPAMAQLAPMQPQLQPQLLPPLQPLQAQLQHISRDDTTARGNSQDNSRIESAFSGMQLHDFTPVAPDTTSVCYSRPTPAGFCPKTFGGIMKN